MGARGLARERARHIRSDRRLHYSCSVPCGRWGIGGRQTAGRCHMTTWTGMRRLVGARQRADECTAGRTWFDGPRGNSSRTRQLGLTASEV
jgi:hypothetical protein